MASVRPTNTINLVLQHMNRTLPLVDKELSRWREKASNIPDMKLREQALQSIRTKAFHCQGGAIFSSYPGADRALTTRFIVAYQTISDYLDNLVDSLSLHDEQAFSQLHLAMSEALDQDAQLSAYYAYYPYQDDGGYLETLVQTCRDACTQPNYHLVKQHMLELATHYSHLQTYKHLHAKDREAKLIGWVKEHLPGYPAFEPWEFAASTGSTLGQFCLFAAACDLALTDESVKRLKETYFPWICALHILLDYLVDQQIDGETAQLNFVSYYKSPLESLERMTELVDSAARQIELLPHKGFHQVVIGGLLGLYLSDPKAAHPQVQPVATALLRKGGASARILHLLCRLLRRSRVIS